MDGGGGGEGGVEVCECVVVGLTLINIALAVGVRLAVGPLLYVGHVLVKVRQRHRVLLVDLPLHVRLQHRPLIVGKRHGEQGLGVAHELVDVSLSRHLDGHGQDGTERGGKINESGHFWFRLLVATIDCI